MRKWMRTMDGYQETREVEKQSVKEDEQIKENLRKSTSWIIHESSEQVSKTVSNATTLMIFKHFITTTGAYQIKRWTNLHKCRRTYQQTDQWPSTSTQNSIMLWKNQWIMRDEEKTAYIPGSSSKKKSSLSFLNEFLPPYSFFNISPRSPLFSFLFSFFPFVLSS